MAQDISPEAADVRQRCRLLRRLTLDSPDSTERDRATRVINVQRLLNPAIITITNAESKLRELGVVSELEIQALHQCQRLLYEVLTVAVINAGKSHGVKDSAEDFIGSE